MFESDMDEMVALKNVVLCRPLKVCRPERKERRFKLSLEDFERKNKKLEQIASQRGPTRAGKVNSETLGSAQAAYTVPNPYL